MARLPVPGGDVGSWGDVLNEYLGVEHDATGKLKSTAGSSLGDHIADVDVSAIALHHTLGTGATQAAAGNHTHPGGVTVTVLVAASNASSHVKSSADYVCTGSNDQVVISQAIAALPAIGGTVVLSEGLFTVNTTAIAGWLNPFVSNLRLVGAGANSTTIKLANGQNSRILTQSTAISGLTLEGITWDANGQNQTDGAQRDDRDALQLNNITHLRFLNSCVTNTRHGAGLRVSQCDFALYQGNRFYNNGVSTTVGNNFISDHTFLRNSKHYRVIGNTYLTCTDTGTAQDGVAYSTVIGNVYEDCTLGVSVCNSATEGSSTAAASHHNVVAENVIVGRISGANATGIKVSTFGNTAAGNMHDVVLTGNNITNCDRALWIEEVDRIIVTNNVLGDAAGTNKQLIIVSTTGTLNNCKITGNMLYNTSNRGLSFSSGGTTNNLEFTNNTLISVSTPVGGTIPASAIIRLNNGYKTEAGGTVSVADGGTISHGLATAPIVVSVLPTVAGRLVAVTAVSATTITIALKDSTGAPVSVAENVMWSARTAV